MKKIACPLALAIALLAATCLGQTPATHPAELNGLFGMQPAAPASSWNIEELDVPAGTTVADLLVYVQRKDPSFQYIVGAPGDWQKLTVPQMKLHNVTPQHIVEILNKLVPDVEQIATGRKKALQEILSLLESAVTQADASVRPALKLHEETEVLLVTGTRSQLDAISQSLKALQSAEASGQYKLRYENLMQENRAVARTVSSLRINLENLQATDGSLRNRLSSPEKENAALNEQLQQSKSASPGAGEKH